MTEQEVQQAVREMRERVPTQKDKDDITRLKALGWKPKAIASGLELDVDTVRYLYRKL